MEWILKICGGAVICTAALAIIKSVKQEYAFAVRTVGVILLFGMMISAVSPIVSWAGELLDLGGAGEFKEIIYTSLGIGAVTCVSSMICRECGETSLADTVETAGRIAALLLSIPLVKQILDKAMSLID